MGTGYPVNACRRGKRYEELKPSPLSKTPVCVSNVQPNETVRSLVNHNIVCYATPTQHQYGQVKLSACGHWNGRDVVCSIDNNISWQVCPINCITFPFPFWCTEMKTETDFITIHDRHSLEAKQFLSRVVKMVLHR